MERLPNLGALPPNPRDLPLLSARMQVLFVGRLRAALAAAPCLPAAEPVLGSHPCVALSHPGQVASVCIRQLRRSSEKRLTVTTNRGVSNYDW